MSKIFLTDCDGAILDWFAGLERFLEKNYPNLTLDTKHYSLGLPKEFLDKCVDEFNTSPEFANLPALKDSKEYLQKINDLGYKFVAITTCLGNDYTRLMREYNLEGLFGPDIFETVHCLKIGTSKLPILESYSPTYYLDDKLKHCESAVKAGHKAFQMLHTYNENDNRPDNIIPVRNWSQIYEIILQDNF